MTRVEKLKGQLRSWIRELDAEGPQASLAPAMITAFQNEIWALEQAEIAKADAATVAKLERGRP